jgi:hypothetical protein
MLRMIAAVNIMENNYIATVIGRTKRSPILTIILFLLSLPVAIFHLGSHLAEAIDILHSVSIVGESDAIAG